MITVVCLFKMMLSKKKSFQSEASHAFLLCADFVCDDIVH